MSIIKKMGNVINFHATSKSVTVRESLTGHVRQEENPADFLTKVVTKQKKKHLVLLLLYYIQDKICSMAYQIVCTNACLRGKENYGCVYCLCPEEVS